VELIPFLIEILEECDNDEEFLMTMADQLRALEKYIEPSQVHILLAPLEIISSMEDIQVRNKAIDCIKDLVHE
jgi:serine/threonine-protein phosphatase 2A regulatory subunit A